MSSTRDGGRASAAAAQSSSAKLKTKSGGRRGLLQDPARPQQDDLMPHAAQDAADGLTCAGCRTLPGVVGERRMICPDCFKSNVILILCGRVPSLNDHGALLADQSIHRRSFFDPAAAQLGF